MTLPEISKYRLSRPFIRRYLDIEYGISAIQEKKLALVDPEKWEDKNDVFLLSTYKNICSFEQVHAACFTTAPERNHHWSSFSSKQYSLCLVFTKRLFLQRIKRENPDLLCGHVQYLSSTQLSSTSAVDTDKIPFIKGNGYLAEEEYRLVMGSKNKSGDIVKIDFDLQFLDHILLAPNCPKYIERAVNREISDSSLPNSIRIRRSTLPDDQDWKNAALLTTF